MKKLLNTLLKHTVIFIFVLLEIKKEKTVSPENAEQLKKFGNLILIIIGVFVIKSMF